MTYDLDKRDFDKAMNNAYADFMNGHTNAEEFVEDCREGAKAWLTKYFPTWDGE
jgi:hypothetical protein